MKTVTEVTTMIRTPLTALALAVLCACSWNVDNLPGQCQQTSDCDAGVCDTTSGVGLCAASCGQVVCGPDQMCSNNICVAAECTPHCTTGQSCEHIDGGLTCVQTDCFPACDSSYQMCNTQATPPVCVATSCHPACGNNEQCVPGDGGFSCIPLTAGAIVVTQPLPNAVTGVVTPLAISATAGAPNGGPTKVRLSVEQASTDAGATTVVPTGNQGVYAGNVSLADAGFKTGPANVVGTVFYPLDGGQTSVDSPAIQIQIDVDPPAFGAPSDDRGAGFYSGVATPAQTATVTIPINDVGPANVNPSSVVLLAAGHQYPASSAQFPDGGNGNYVFSVTVAELNSNSNFLGPVPYSVTAADNVGNTATLTTGSLPLDNIPPSVSAALYDAGWYGGDAGISVAVHVADQASGSGLDAGSVALVLGNGTTLTGPAFSGTDMYTFTTTGAAIRQGGQGPVLFNVQAADNAGNVALVDGGQILVDEQAPAIDSSTVANGTSGIWFARDAGSIAVTLTTDDGSGSGPKTASLTAASTTFAPAGSNDAGVFTFHVPGSVQTAGSEVQIALTATATDAVGNTSPGTTLSSVLSIDDAAPQISGLTLVTAPRVAISGTSWFNQSDSGAIEVDATIADNGSGVVAAKLIKAGGVQVDDGHPTLPSFPATGSHLYKFFISRAAGPIVAGAEGSFSVSVVATDGVGNTQTSAASLTVGIDGKPPSLSIASPFYPPKDCVTGVVCGHDGTHFYRKGETAAIGFTGSDSGSGIDTSNQTSPASWQIGATGDLNKTTGPAAFATTQFQFTPDFSHAAFTSDVTGAGTVEVLLTLQDRVGNTTTTDLVNGTAVNVTRLRWAQHNAAFSSFSGSPIATTTYPAAPVPQVIFAGTNTSTDPVVGYGPDGTRLWGAGHAQGLGVITNDLTYSPVSNIVYAFQSNGTSFYGFHLGANGNYDSTYQVCGSIFAGLSGSTSLLEVGNTEYGLVSDTGAGTLYALHGSVGATGGSCTAPKSVSSTGTQWATMTTPTTNGTTVYFGHDSALATVNFAGTFTNLTDPALITSVKVFNRVSIATGLFFGDISHSDEYRDLQAGPPVAVNAAWALNPTAGQDANFDPPAADAVVANNLVFGEFATEGKLHGFYVAAGTGQTAGAQAFSYPASGTIPNVTAPAVAADGTLYVTSNNTVQAVSIAAGASSTTASQVWKFTGTGANYGATTVSVASTPTPAVIDANGVVYFGDGGGNLFAVISDSAGPLAKGAGAWPRAGGDNCNSGNSSFNCQ